MKSIIEICKEMKSDTLNNYVVPGLACSLLSKRDSKVRLFEASRIQQREIVPHSHRFDSAALVLRGKVTNKIWKIDEDPLSNNDTYEIAESMYRNEPGQYTLNSEGKVIKPFNIFTYKYAEGDSYYMSHEAIHSVEFSKDAIVLFFEGPMVKNFNTVLLPHVDGETINTLRIEPWMFKKND